LPTSRRYRDNTEVNVVPHAVSDVAGEMPFYTSDQFPGIHSLAPFDPSHRAAGTVTVSTLSHGLARLSVAAVAALKIDVEGADLMALRGFAFDRWRPELVMVEFMDDRGGAHFGYTHHEMAELMMTHGYSAFVSEWAPLQGYGGSLRWRSLHRYRLGAVLAPNVWGNLLFVQPRDAWKLWSAAAQTLVRLNARRVVAGLPLIGPVARAVKRLATSAA